MTKKITPTICWRSVAQHIQVFLLLKKLSGEFCLILTSNPDLLTVGSVEINLASKMAVDLWFQSNLELTAETC